MGVEHYKFARESTLDNYSSMRAHDYSYAVPIIFCTQKIMSLIYVLAYEVQELSKSKYVVNVFEYIQLCIYAPISAWMFKCV